MSSRSRWHWPLCWLLCSSAPIGQAHAQPTPPEAAQTDPGSDSGSVSIPEPDPSLVVDDSEVSASHAALAKRRYSTLQTELQAVRREREDSSLLLPWTVLGTGIAMAVVGLSIGLSDAFCDGSCSGPFISSWLVMGGATVGGAGGVWLALEQRDQAELRRRQDTLENELQYLEWNAALPEAGAGAARAVLTLRHAF
jgi:hypothetical protein